MLGSFDFFDSLTLPRLKFAQLRGLSFMKILEIVHFNNSQCTYFTLVIGLQPFEIFLGSLESLLDLLCFLGKHVSFTCGNIDLCLLSIDFSSPGLELLLLDFDLVVEDLCLIYM